MTTYNEKYNKIVDLSGLSEAEKSLVESVQREGELQYRDQLVAILRRTKQLLQETGEENPRLTIDSFIAIVENEEEED